MTDQTLGPLTADGLLVNPFGTTFSEKQRLEIQRRRTAEIDAAVAERQAAEEQAAADRDRERREAGAARLEAYRTQCELRWADNGGLPVDFAKAWPSLRDRWLADQLTDTESRLGRDVARLRADPLYQV